MGQQLDCTLLKQTFWKPKIKKVRVALSVYLLNFADNATEEICWVLHEVMSYSCLNLGMWFKFLINMEKRFLFFFSWNIFGFIQTHTLTAFTCHMKISLSWLSSKDNLLQSVGKPKNFASFKSVSVSSENKYSFTGYQLSLWSS